MIGIYCIEHVESGKKYVGKSKKTTYRLYVHKYYLRKVERSKDCNRHLHAAVQKYGWGSFKTYLLETFEVLDEQLLKERELYWMDFYNTCDRNFGYNLRRDSSTGMIILEETKLLQSQRHSGENNANFGNRWNDEQKLKMAEDLAYRRKWSGKYGKDYRDKIGKASSKTWKDEEKKAKMAKAVSKTKEEKHQFLQFTRDGTYIKTWGTVREIVEENPNYKWQNIYSVCNGYKPTYMGFIWKKELKG